MMLLFGKLVLNRESWPIHQAIIESVLRSFYGCHNSCENVTFACSIFFQRPTQMTTNALNCRITNNNLNIMNNVNIISQIHTINMYKVKDKQYMFWQKLKVNLSTNNYKMWTHLSQLIKIPNFTNTLKKILQNILQKLQKYKYSLFKLIIETWLILTTFFHSLKYRHYKTK
jgi:hypothetical protein